MGDERQNPKPLCILRSVSHKQELALAIFHNLALIHSSQEDAQVCNDLFDALTIPLKNGHDLTFETHCVKKGNRYFNCVTPVGLEYGTDKTNPELLKEPTYGEIHNYMYGILFKAERIRFQIARFGGECFDSFYDDNFEKDFCVELNMVAPDEITRIDLKLFEGTVISVSHAELIEVDPYLQPFRPGYLWVPETSKSTD